VASCDLAYKNLRQQMEQELKERLVMSIDARVDDVTVHASGAGELRLKDRPGRPGRGPQDAGSPTSRAAGPERAGIAGQTVLFFDNCPGDVWKLEGKDIWGGANNIMLGDVEIAEREGYTKIRFVVDSISAVLDKVPAPEEPPDQPD
jgi:hypothetical protein